MKPVHIDLLHPHEEAPDPEPVPRRTPKPTRRLVTALAVFGVMVTSVLSYGVVAGGESAGGSFPSLSFFSTLRHLISAEDRGLRGEKLDRINVLLMGIGGAGHDGPELTDTILLASYQPSTNKVGLLSIPRDMAVAIPGFGERKINSANAYGEATMAGSGPQLASTVVEQTFGQPVDYYVRVDFDGFAKLIDTVGGLDIYVDRSFVDPSYPVLGKEETNCGNVESADPASSESVSQPTYGCRFENLSFREGWVHMDGSTALKYVRSRHGTNGEASDFARSRRQQKVILAVKDKVLSVGTLLNPLRLNELRDTLQKNIVTNFETWELLRLAQAFNGFDTSKLSTRVLDASDDSPLYATSLNGAYVLLPKNDDWRPIRDAAEHIFDAPAEVVIAPKPKPAFPHVEVQNGTTIAGLALSISQRLGGQGYDVVRISNAAQRGYDHTVIYDLTDGKGSETLQQLQEYFKADIARASGGRLTDDNAIAKKLSLPSDNTSNPEVAVDFLIILGEHSASLVKK